MSEISVPSSVYKRRRIQRNPSAVLPLSQSSTPTFVYKRRKVQPVFATQFSTNTSESDNYYTLNSSEAISVAPDLIPFGSNRPDLASKSGSVDGSIRDESINEPESKMCKILDLLAVNDSCSSSKSNVDLGSAFLKHQVDDVGECSSSGGLGKDIAETNSCFSFLRHHGVLEQRLSCKTSHSKKLTGVKNSIYGLRSCKVCDRSATTLKMLICDLCEESFHMSCCNPHIKMVPVGDWFCDSCWKKSRKLPKIDSGPIASMLRDTGPYISNVRIGNDFQAELPDWSGPHTKKLDSYREPTETSPLERASYQEWVSSKLSRLSSIGNWLQCQEVIDGVKGTICGKWRRAPLFEVQTNDWECFRSVFWDPAHADCAVPQELDTDQVLKHLKYIEMLRPRLSAKRWKSGVHKGLDCQEHTGDPKNTQNS